MPLPTLKNLFVSETCLRFCALDSQISFLALAVASKKIPKPSVKLAQSGPNLAQSVKSNSNPNEKSFYQLLLLSLAAGVSNLDPSQPKSCRQPSCYCEKCGCLGFESPSDRIENIWNRGIIRLLKSRKCHLRTFERENLLIAHHVKVEICLHRHTRIRPKGRHYRGEIIVLYSLN